MTFRRIAYRVGMGMWIGAILVLLYGMFAALVQDFETVIWYQLAGLVEGFIGAGTFVIADCWVKGSRIDEKLPRIH